MVALPKSELKKRGERSLPKVLYYLPDIEYASPNSILTAIGMTAARYGKIKQIQIFCNANRLGEALWLIEMDSNAQLVAQELGAKRIGELIYKRERFKPGFACKLQRFNDENRFCDECKPTPERLIEMVKMWGIK